MTIHQLKDRCWELRPPLGEEDERHYGTRAEALEDVREKVRDDAEWRAGRSPWRLRLMPLYRLLSRLRPGTPRARQVAAACWLAQCDGECEQVIDEEGESYTVHCDSRQAAESLAASYEWVYSADGRLIFCDEDAPAAAEPIPPSPADLEAAGQMRLIP